MIIENTFSVSRPIDQAWDLLTDLEGIAPCMPGARLTEVEGETYFGEVRVRLGPIQTRFRGEASFQERDAENHRAVINARGKDTGGKGLASATITAQLAPGETSDLTAVSVSTDLTISGKIAQFGRSAVGDVSAKLLTQFADCLESRLQGSGAPDVANGTGEGEVSASAADRPKAAAEESDQSEEDANGEGASWVAGVPDLPHSGEEAEPAEAGPTDAEASEQEVDAEPSAAEYSEDSEQADAGEPGAEDGTRRRKIDSPEPEPIDLVNTAGESVTRSLVPIAIIAVLVVIVIVLVII